MRVKRDFIFNAMKFIKLRTDNINHRVEYYRRKKLKQSKIYDNDGSLLLHHCDDMLTKTVQPVFVLSPGRSGTMTLAELMNLSPFIDAYHEPEPNLFNISYYVHMTHDERGLHKYIDDILKISRDHLIIWSHQHGKIYFESNNRLTQLASFVADRYSSCRFIFLVRHPYHFIRSAMRRNYYAGHPYDATRIHPHSNDPYYDRWDSMSQIEKCAWLWNRNNEDTLALINKLPSERFILLKAESFFNGEGYKNLFRFVVDAPIPSENKIKKVLGKQLNQQKQGEFPDVKDWKYSYLQSVNPILEETLHQLDYLGVRY
jgi:hypothetical protein